MNAALAGYIVEEYISLYHIYRQIIWDTLAQGENPIPITDQVESVEITEQ